MVADRALGQTMKNRETEKKQYEITPAVHTKKELTITNSQKRGGGGHASEFAPAKKKQSKTKARRSIPSPSAGRARRTRGSGKRYTNKKELGLNENA